MRWQVCVAAASSPRVKVETVIPFGGWKPPLRKLPWNMSQPKLITVLLSLSLLLLLSPLAPAQQPIQKKVPWEGTQAFRSLLDLFKQKSIKKLDDLRNVAPRDTTIIVFGDTSALRRIERRIGSLKQFQQAGGAILVATDRRERRVLKRNFNVTVTGEQIFPDMKGSYRNIVSCPLVRERLETGHPLFTGLRQGIATNQPSRIILDRSDLRPLGSYSDVLAIFTLPDRRIGQQFPMINFAGAKAILPFIVGTNSTSPPDNRIIIMAGHGVFLNGMMAHRDNDNFQFAYNCVRWLTNDGERKYVLFVEEGKVQTKFDMPLYVLPPIEVPLEEILNKLIDKARHRPLDALNDADKLAHIVEKTGLITKTYERFGQPFLDRYVNHFGTVQALLVGLTLLLVGRGLWQLVRSLHRQESGVPLSERIVESKQTDHPLLSQRHEAMMLQGNLWEAARAVSRRWFEKHMPVDPIRDEPPAVSAQGWWARRRWQRRINELWELAFGPQPFPMSIRDFRALLRELGKLDSALTDKRFQWRV